nr:hypothetical protein [uncultured Carboxylicivirga sp.]
MDFDLIGKVKRTRLYYSQSLMPLLEAIINSIHATLYSEIENGIIEVELIRDTTEQNLGLDIEDLRPIKSFKITDNGIGFNELNYKSFGTSESIHKLSLGGKGVGRFLWLKAFKNVSVDSSFRNNGSFKRRTFDFKLVDTGVVNHNITVLENPNRKTTIQLEDFYPDYQRTCPKSIEELSDKIMQHCLSYLIKENCPLIILSDPLDHKKITINDIYKKDVQKIESITFPVKRHSFKLDLFKVFNILTQSAIHYCADDREVISKALKDDIPELNKRIKSGEEEFYLKAYLSSDYLNEIVNSERTNFDFPQDSEMFDEYVSEEELKRRLIPQIEKGVSKYLKEIRETKLDKIKQYVFKKAPQYRSLLKYKISEIEKLPLLSETKLEMELFKLQHKLELDVKREGRKIFKEIKNVKDFEDYQEKYDEYLTKVVDVGSMSLSKYILHRKTVIDILDKHIRGNKFGEFAKEETIHRLIFPLRCTSDDVDYEDHNLWLIDERLAYHQYLASDKPFKKLEIVDADSNDRPDLISFNEYYENKFAFSDSKSKFQSIVIVELKRPMRKSYDTDDENPIDQVLNYIDNIKNDKKTLKDERLFNVKEIPFYCYIICDLTPKIKTVAKRHDFTETFDGEGYFGYRKEYNAYFEIISYDKLLDDSKKRNQILFDKLKLPI